MKKINTILQPITFKCVRIRCAFFRDILTCRRSDYVRVVFRLTFWSSAGDLRANFRPGLVFYWLFVIEIRYHLFCGHN